MTTLIALLSEGEKTISDVLSLIKVGDFEKIYLICNDYWFENFDSKNQNIIKLKLDTTDSKMTINAFSKFFNSSINDLEVALNIASGTGKEHMLIISSIIKAGLGFRFVYFENNKVQQFNILKENYTNVDFTM